MLPNKPRKKPRSTNYRLPHGDDIAEFISDNIVSVKQYLEPLFGQRYNDAINWTPSILPDHYEPKPKGHGSNNTHYVVPKIDAIFGGRSIYKAGLKWDEVENQAVELFDLEQYEESKTRNIDYWRKIEIDQKEYWQGCEIKKTTGSFSKPPIFIRSSEAQLKALSSIDPLRENHISPSVYIIGSIDYCQVHKEWVITWWFYPVKNASDFILFNTSDFKWSPMKTVTNDGWITRP